MDHTWELPHCAMSNFMISGRPAVQGRRRPLNIAGVQHEPDPAVNAFLLALP
jgi:hypothetical protein